MKKCIFPAVLSWVCVAYLFKGIYVSYMNPVSKEKSALLGEGTQWSSAITDHSWPFSPVNSWGTDLFWAVPARHFQHRIAAEELTLTILYIQALPQNSAAASSWSPFTEPSRHGQGKMCHCFSRGFLQRLFFKEWSEQSSANSATPAEMLQPRDAAALSAQVGSAGHGSFCSGKQSHGEVPSDFVLIYFALL